MSDNHKKISLGFVKDKVEEGTHLCLVFTDDSERVDSLLKFILAGMQNDERTACFSENITENEIRDFFKQNDISYDERKDKEAITFGKTNEVYFKDNTFEPDRMLGILEQFYEDAKKMGFTASRVIGEMSPLIQEVKGGERLLEYESRVTKLLEKCPLTAVCQYDANLFDGSTIMDVLKVHPKMVVNGAVLENPFYIKPDEFLENTGQKA